MQNLAANMKLGEECPENDVEMSDDEECIGEIWTFPGGPYVDVMDTNSRQAIQAQIDELIDEFYDVDAKQDMESCLRELPCLRILAPPGARDVAMPPRIGLAFFVVD